MGTKFWAFLWVISIAGILAFVGKFSPEIAAFFGTVTGAFFGFQMGRNKRNGKT